MGSTSARSARAYTRELDIADLTHKKSRMRDLFIFSDDDLISVISLHKDALVIIAVVSDFNINRILVDTRSEADILYYNAFLKMDFTNDMLRPSVYSLTGFIDDLVVELRLATMPSSGAHPYTRQCYAIKLGLNKKKTKGESFAPPTRDLGEEDKQKEIAEGKKKVSIQSIILDNLRTTSSRIVAL
ncbi:hypothetical protein NE237_025263 [Protea cynaroides]|uniref:Uncharacterized protein n=1 Tax=Protea cynaroides TaxID=273540 RepID=A0A9Q0H5X9_9MAGN|nr:hypothetical protein NE237_025263 [Protea cynaroides]